MKQKGSGLQFWSQCESSIVSHTLCHWQTAFQHIWAYRHVSIQEYILQRTCWFTHGAARYSDIDHGIDWISHSMAQERFGINPPSSDDFKRRGPGNSGVIQRPRYNNIILPRWKISEGGHYRTPWSKNNNNLQRSKYKHYRSKLLNTFFKVLL